MSDLRETEGWHNPHIRCLHCGASFHVRVSEMRDGRLFAACSKCLSGCDHCIAQFNKGEQLFPSPPQKAAPETYGCKQGHHGPFDDGRCLACEEPAPEPPSTGGG